MTSAANTITLTTAPSDWRGRPHGRLAINLLVADVRGARRVSDLERRRMGGGPHDDFDPAAAPIGSMPFSDAVDMTGATVQVGEPQYCLSTQESVWYAITPTQSGTLAANTAGSSAVPTGHGLPRRRGRPSAGCRF